MRNLRLILLVGLLALLLGSPQPSYATAITVDGNPSDWPAGAFLATDPADVIEPSTSANVPDVDISNFYFTNSTTTLYMRFDTYGTPTRWEDISGGDPQVRICLDTDDNIATGATISVCQNQQGVNFQVLLTGTGPSSLTATARACAAICNGAFVSGVMAATAGNVTEVSIPLSGLGINTNRIIRTAVYFDNRETPNDDNTPNSGTFGTIVGCTNPTPCSPTAITLSSFSTSSPLSLPWLPLGLVALPVAGGAAFFMRRRATRRG